MAGKVELVIMGKALTEEDTGALKNVLESLIQNKVDLRDKVEVSVKDSYEEVQKKGEGPKEAVRILLVSNGYCKANSKTMEGEKNICVFFKDGLTPDVVRNAQKCGAFGVFPVDRFYGEKKEYAEIARFETVMKRVIRNKLAAYYPESEFFKRIDWKVSKTDDARDDYLSLFADTSSHETMVKARQVIRATKNYSGCLDKFHSGVGDKLKKLHELEISEKQNVEKETVHLLKEIEKRSNEMEASFRKPITILLTGPTGCGKTLLAEYMARELGFCAPERFAKISLVNTSENLLESELFGTFEGAFTGAKFRIGKMVSMAGSAVFLDEIGEIGASVQAKLLTYLDDLRVIIDGYSDPRGVKIPLLLIAATNRDLQAEAKRGNFRNDLYQRFSYEIKVPALKERMSDFRYMLSYLLQKKNIEQGAGIARISLRAIEKLESHDYPGNFRELERVVKTAIMNAEMEERDIVLSEDVVI